MSVRTLLAELDAAGVHLTLSGNDLRYQTRPGVSIALYRERIADYKPALLAELLKAEISAALNVEPADFDRPAYLRLMARWYAAEADVAAGSHGDGDERSRHPRDAARSVGHVCPGETHSEGRTDPAEPQPIGCGKPEICDTLGPCPSYLATNICPLTPSLGSKPAA